MSKKNKKINFNININNIFKKKLFSKESFIIEKLLKPSTSRNIKFRIFRENNNSGFIPKKENHKNKIIQDENSKIFLPSEKLIHLNESIIKSFQEMCYLQNKAKEQYESDKKLDDFFFKRYKNYLKQEKVKAKKINTKRNKSASINFQKNGIFDELLDKYKKRDGILYTKEIYNDKDLFQETPILSKNEEKMKFFYIYNYDKYANKTNLNYKDILKSKKIEKSKFNKIKFDQLLLNKFYNKLLSLAQKKIYEKQNKDIPKKLNYRYRYIGNKDIKAAREIPQLKKEIKKIETLYNRMNKSRNSIANINTNINIFNNYKTRNKAQSFHFKKIFYKKFNESNNDTPKENKLTERNEENKNQTLTPMKKKNLFIGHRNLKSHKNILNSQSYSCKHKEKNKDDKSIISQKTKTTFYSTKNKMDKTVTFSPKSTFGKTFYKSKDITDIKNTENAYDFIKSMTYNNKKLILNKIESYYDSRGYKIDKIKNGINMEDLYNYLDNIKHIVGNYNCKQKINSLYLLSSKRLSEKMKLNLNEISDLDKDISSAENRYYLSLLKNQSL